MSHGEHPFQRALLRTARKYPLRPAVSDPGRRPVTHLALMLRSLRRARRLRSYGDRIASPIALRFSRGVELIEHLLGVLWAGGSYVCLDPSADDDDWLAGLRALGVRLLIHAPGLGPPPDLRAEDLLCVPGAGCWSLPLPRPTAPSASEDWVCALVRTSGTSGEPCAVPQEARGILHHAEWTLASERIDADSRLSWLSSPGVAAAHSHLFAALLSGACLCPFDPARSGLSAMSRWLREERVTHLHATPSLLRAWLDSLPDGASLPDLRCVKLGGEPARAADARLLRRRFGPAVRLLNGLGMAEATGNVTGCEITVADETGTGLLPIGRPVPGRGVTVENEAGEEVAPGEVGEIVVRDEWVAPGYLPAGAREAIRETGRRGVRELRTGDAGTCDEQGRLIHLGRLDRRIRVRGMSVDLAEVEARIASLETVSQVAALPEPGGAGYRVAVVLRPGAREDDRRAAQRLASRLPRVRPARIALFEALPRRSNGKRDDALLLQQWPEQAPAEWTPRQAYLREAWIEVLGHADFGPHDRFADVGGDSLLAMNLALRLERFAQREVEMADLARFPTVADQAAALEGGRLGVAARPSHTQFHSEWVRLPAAAARRTALVHPGGYCRESDIWLAREVMDGLAADTTLLVARTNIEDPRIGPPRDWSEVFEPLYRGVPEESGLLLVGICLGSVVMAEIAERLRAAGRAEVDLVLLDPWTPGLGRSAAGLTEGEHAESVLRYYALFKSRAYPPLGSLRHVLLSRDDSHFEARRAYWSSRLPSPDCVHVVQGDHLSFVREHCAETARALAAVTRLPPACPTASPKR